MSTLAVSAEEFNDIVLESPAPVLVDFWAEWCGPCRMMNPILEKLSNEHGERLLVVKVDADKNAELAAEYGVVSIPTMLTVVNGKVTKTMVGARTYPALLEELSNIL